MTYKKAKIAGVEKNTAKVSKRKINTYPKQKKQSNKQIGGQQVASRSLQVLKHKLAQVTTKLEQVQQRLKSAETSLNKTVESNGFMTLFFGVAHEIRHIDMSLDLIDMLKVALEIMVSSNHEGIGQGAIFLTEEGGQGAYLDMAVYYGIPEGACQQCKKLSFGFDCFCAQAAREEKVVFASEHLGAKEPHGHCCVPIRYQDVTIGILNLFLSLGFRRTSTDELIMSNLGEEIGMLIGRKRIRDELKKQANYDALTGLPTRNLLLERLNHSINLLRRSDDAFTVMFIDLDNFKPINDNHGHDAGDKVLVALSKRMLSCARDGDTVARMSGDEFVFILQGTASNQVAIDVAERLTTIVSSPIALDDGVEVQVGLSIGILRCWDKSQDAETVLKNADSTMYQVKERGKGGYLFCKK